MQPTRLLRPWDFPGKSTGVGCHFLLQGIFPTQGLKPGLPHCRQTLYCLSHHGSPDWLSPLKSLFSLIDSLIKALERKPLPPFPSSCAGAWAEPMLSRAFYLISCFYLGCLQALAGLSQGSQQATAWNWVRGSLGITRSEFQSWLLHSHTGLNLVWSWKKANLH